MRDINAWLETVPGLKTEKGAKARLDKMMDLIVENNSKFMIFRKSDNTFVPVVLLSPKDWAAGAYAHNGICVTN